MSAVWQVQEAKNHFGTVIDRALTEGPQTVTRHGKPVVRIVAIEEAETLPVAKRSFGNDGFLEHLLSAPKDAEFAALLEERHSIKDIPPLGE